MNHQIIRLFCSLLVLFVTASAQDVSSDSVNVIIPQARVICYPCPRPIPQPVQIK